MARASHRDKLLSEGLKVVHERGYGGASIRDIVKAAAAPQGSFTNHFASKEAFGLEVLGLYDAKVQEVIQQTLRNEAMPPLKRLKSYIDSVIAAVDGYGSKRGCMYGNTSAEATDETEALRMRVVEMLNGVTASVEHCLRAAVSAGEIPAGAKVRDMAGYIVSSLQGAILLSKAYRSVAPLERFKRILFSTILKP
jgi:TetR/AcrR family transcriptional repressor of nem operon